MSDTIDPKTGKAHREFFAIDLGGVWTPIAPGIEVLHLAGHLDEAAGTGNLNRLVRWAPHARIDAVKVHEFYKEVLVVSGTLRVASQDDPGRIDDFPALSFACRPPGAKHGPFEAGPDGCLLFETMYYVD